MSLLVIGGTGTLGRQLVRKALNEGFQVKCLVRNFRKASFLKEWGAELVYGDLTIPETIPLSLYGVTAIIDASTTRSSNFYTIHKVDLEAKSILLESAIKAKVSRYIFFSILDSYNYKNIPLIKLKLLIENQLQNSPIDYTIFYLSGFFQGLIPQYAVPILDQNSVWITLENAGVCYISTQDIANLTIKSLSIDQFQNKKLPMIGNKSWTSKEIIQLCEKISGKSAKITKIPIDLLKIIRIITRFFQWTWSISEKLSFIEVLSSNINSSISMKEILYILRVEYNNIESLEQYFQEYFQRIMKKIKELSYNLDYTKDTNDLDF
uniref:NmrA-like domain-containing protein n=1 Tax=Bostrychia moritziana TaxID=103713 RepID=A0A1Z1M6K8_BOSMO|nr:hypothetical protein [Bostrychia moritziana]ARW61646.1 hypothetical protein [Bostrychia moritziana]